MYADSRNSHSSIDQICGATWWRYASRFEEIATAAIRGNAPKRSHASQPAVRPSHPKRMAIPIRSSS
jgi:hypothetical protein